MQIVKPRSYQRQDKDFQIETSLEKFKAFGLTEPLSSTKKLFVEKLPLKGCSTGTYFEFPQIASSAEDKLFIKEEFAERVLVKLEACVGVGIYSIRLSYSDGSTSPLFGTKEPNQVMSIGRESKEVTDQETICTIKM